MRYLSVCSGIEAATCAWHNLGWVPFAFSEIEPFPSAVLAHHYPDVPNFGDMTKFKEWPDANVDVLVGGTPCQSFSVAGLRKGLDDPRGNLMLTYLAIAAKYRPKWLVWENVPGVLSSNGGLDFASLLRGLEECGYGFAYRVLDAQYFGVAQRRRRVFVVGCLGDWRRAAAVLFERESLLGNPAPSREKGQVVTPTIRAGTANGGAGHGARSGDGKDELIVPVSTFECGGIGAYRSSSSSPILRTGADLGPGCEALVCMSSGQANAEIAVERRTTLNCLHEAPIVAHSLRGEGFDASEDGTGRGTPLTVVHGTQDPCTDKHLAFALGRNSGQENAVAFAQNQRDEVRIMEVAGALASEPGMKQQTYLAVQPAPTFAVRTANTNANGHGISDSVAHTLDGANGQAAIHGMQVRRLTPVECERLQGFPDGYTDIKPKGKPTADGPRYKALGNSMAVPVMRWIGERIAMVDAIPLASEIAA